MRLFPWKRMNLTPSNRAVLQNIFSDMRLASTLCCLCFFVCVWSDLEQKKTKQLLTGLPQPVKIQESTASLVKLTEVLAIFS